MQQALTMIRDKKKTLNIANIFIDKNTVTLLFI